eukprot:PITA_35873
MWKLKMEDLLVDKDQWIVVDPGTKPTEVTDEEWKKLDRKAKSTIRLCVSDSVLLNVSGEATEKALWDKLGTLYQSKSLVNKLFLRKKLYNLRMKDGDSLTEHLNVFNTVVSQLLSVDIKISDEDKCISLLCSQPDSWDSLVIAIGSNATALQFDEIVSALLTEEMRRKNMDNQNGDALSVVCWKCGKEGHFRRECKSKAPDKGKGSDDAPSAKVKTTSDEGGDVYLASSSTHVDHEAWLIDSGASFHFTPHREWFCEYEKYDGGDVFLGDDRKARIIGRRKVKLKLQGVNTVFDKDTCKMVRGALVLMRGVWIGTLYKLQGSTVVDGCNSSMVPENGAENLVVSREKTMLWHQRLGHIGEKGLRILHGKGMVEGMSNSSLDFDCCENCVYGKQNRVSFPSGGKRTKQILELVHSDVFGPVKVPSLEDYSIYTSAKWSRRRMNKTLMERARSMLSGAGLGQEFWAEAVDTACYLVNRSPSSALEDKTPQEVWTGKTPSLSHLRVFGCDAYVHVPKEKRTKLDSKSEKCIFIGYKDGLKGYKLWNPVTREVVYSRDVVFREVKDVIKHEVQPKEPVKIEFELKEEESDSVAEEESEDESHKLRL